MKISIITPVYNRADCIGRCIESVLSQKDFDDFEMYVIADISTDGTEDIVRGYADKDNRIKLLVLPQRGGINKARNWGIQEATGDYIMILDSDDWLVDDALFTINDSINAYPQYHYFMFEDNDRMEYYKQNGLQKQHTTELHFNDFLSGKISGDFVHVIKAEIIKNNFFNEEVNSYEGFTFMKFYKEAQNTLFIDKIITERERNRDDSATYTMIRSNLHLVKEELDAYYSYLNEFDEYMAKYNDRSNLYYYYNRMLEDCLILKDNNEYKHISNHFSKYNIKIKKYIRLIRFTNTGDLYYTMLKMFYYMKYNVIKKKVG